MPECLPFPQDLIGHVFCLSLCPVSDFKCSTKPSWRAVSPDLGTSVGGDAEHAFCWCRRSVFWEFSILPTAPWFHSFLLCQGTSFIEAPRESTPLPVICQLRMPQNKSLPTSGSNSGFSPLLLNTDQSNSILKLFS